MRAPTRRATQGAALAVALPLAGCASNGTGILLRDLNGPPPAAGTGLTANMESRDDRAEASIPASADRAFAALPAVYAALGVPLTAAATGERVLGLDGAHLRRIGRDPVSAFLWCGTDAVGLPLTEQYRVTLWVISRVTPAGTGAQLTTRVFGTAQPQGTSATTVVCASTGVLEARIAARTRAYAAG